MKLRELRIAADVSQTELARRLKVSQPALSDLEGREVFRMEVDTIRRYVEALGGRLRLQVRMPDGEVVELESSHGIRR